MPTAKVNNNDYLVDNVLFKRSAKALLAQLNNRTPGSPLKLQELQEMLATSIGYPNFHGLATEAYRNDESMNPVLTPEQFWRKSREETLEKNRHILEEICPKSLLRRRSLTWISTALGGVRDDSGHIGGLRLNIPHATVIVGQDSELVLKMWANNHDYSKLYELNKTHTFKEIFDDLVTLLKPGDSNAPRRGIRVRYIGHYYCIGGLSDHSLSTATIAALLGITNIDPEAEFAFALKREDLLKLTSPDFNAPHFHHLRIVDLDEIDVNPKDMRKSVWTSADYYNNFRS